MERLLPYIERLRRVAVPHAPATCPAGMDGGVNIVPPAIDPLAPKNMALSPEDARLRLRPVRDRRRPPADLPGLALRPVEGPARRDRRLPAGQGASGPTCSSRSSARWPPTTPRAGTSSTRRSPTPTATRDIHILNNFNNVGAIEVNAFQSHADVRDPEVDARGLRADGHARRSGRRARSSAATSAGSRCRSRTASPASSSTRVEECAAARAGDPRRPGARQAARAAGKEHVRAHFLTPRYLRDYLRIFHEVNR